MGTNKYVKGKLIAELYRFKNEYNIIPTSKDMGRGYPSASTYRKYFGSWNNALKIVGFDIYEEHTIIEHTSNDICCICRNGTTSGNWYAHDNGIICAACYSGSRNYLHGNLNPESSLGLGVITEHVVAEVLNDCINYNHIKFNSDFDLVSQTFGNINVKSSKLKYNINKQTYSWYFDKTHNASIPDYYVCLGLDENKTEIVFVLFVPGDDEIVTKNGIYISKNKPDRINKYKVDNTLYNKIYQTLDIYTLPEFKNYNGAYNEN